MALYFATRKLRKSDPYMAQNKGVMKLRQAVIAKAARGGNTAPYVSEIKDLHGKLNYLGHADQNHIGLADHDLSGLHDSPGRTSPHIVDYNGKKITLVNVPVKSNKTSWYDGLKEMGRKAMKEGLLTGVGNSLLQGDIKRKVNTTQVPFALNNDTGKWESFHGIGKDGWLNQDQKYVKHHYFDPALMRAGNNLNQFIGDIRHIDHSTIAKISKNKQRQFANIINNKVLGLTPHDDDGNGHYPIKTISENQRRDPNWKEALSDIPASIGRSIREMRTNYRIYAGKKTQHSGKYVEPRPEYRGTKESIDPDSLQAKIQGHISSMYQGKRGMPYWEYKP